MSALRLALRLLPHALFKPWVAVDLITLAWAFRRRGRLSPSPSYLRWRRRLFSGDENHIPTTEEILRFARWRRRLARGH